MSPNNGTCSREIVSSKGIQTMGGRRFKNGILASHCMKQHPYLMLGQWHLIKNALRTTSIYLKNGVFDDPSRIFNCDETGMPLCPPSPKVIDTVGSKNPSYLTGATKAQITVLACASAG